MMKRNIQLCVMVAAGLLVLACKPKIYAGVAIFEESEPGQDPYVTRMIATRDYLRIDDGKDDSNFLLYDRKKKLINNVNHQEKMILHVQSQPVNVESPIKLNNESTSEKSGAPDLDGNEVNHHQFITNKQVCFDVYTSGELLSDLRKAIAEYRRALSGEQAVMLAVTPKDLLSACDLANNIYSPDRHLTKGFPVRQQDFTGRSRQLIDYIEGRVVKEKLFQLPSDYKQLSPQQMRTDTEPSQ